MRVLAERHRVDLRRTCSVTACALQVLERDVGAVEDAGRDRADAADRDVAPESDETPPVTKAWA
jgi:hypothetical protein